MAKALKNTPNRKVAGLAPRNRIRPTAAKPKPRIIAKPTGAAN